MDGIKYEERILLGGKAFDGGGGGGEENRFRFIFSLLNGSLKACQPFIFNNKYSQTFFFLL